MSIKFKSAFTLAEIMIVLLVLTILFAGFAPVVTKKIRSKNSNYLDRWVWSTRNYMAGPMDAYYDSGNNNNFGEVFFGVSPIEENDIHTTYLPYSKIVIRSGPVTTNGILQRQLQLRYGYDSTPYGNFQSSLIADTSNILFGGEYPNLQLANRKNNDNYPQNNFAFGKDALNSLTYTEAQTSGTQVQQAKNNTAVGYKALNTLVKGSDNVSIGSEAGSDSNNISNNVMIGYQAGKSTGGNKNVLIGYNARSGGSNNTFIGYNAGSSSVAVNNNVGIGYNTLHSLSMGEHNIAIGAHALENLTQGSNNVALGYNACSNLTSGSNKTCLGANSGPSVNATSDDIERTYIGGKPFGDNNFGGDAVLEIHNPNTSNANLNNNPDIKSNTTTVINGNLIVRGKIFFTIGNILYPFYYDNNIFGTDKNVCAYSQTSYNLNTVNCPELTNISSSDRRLKNIKSRFNNGLSDIEKINIYNYNYKNDKTKSKNVGVIAQDLQKIFPNAVSTDTNGYLQIRWDEMFFSTINSIKEINKKIILSFKDLINIENKITKLEKENKELEAQVEILSSKVKNLKK
ncbi:tail fiber domain-containing protein [bacterium]|nr:tail fiber domain-containing protein [bacterium]